ncbi:MAG: hypothetical protein LBS21_02460 [Clostridiales bacterium]|nr:hypothetical protein [Clostridiales bacterium]
MSNQNINENAIDLSEIQIVSEAKIDLSEIKVVSEEPVLLNFNAREWHFNEKCKKIGCRTFITDFTGGMVEAFSIGNWNKDWTEIHSAQLTLKKNTPHVFSFWLNGGENDRYQEVCSFEILFNDDYENRYIFKLNRNYIKYSMYYHGWYLYEIPFMTGNNEYTQLRFSSMDAPCAIIPAREKSYYGNLQEEEPIPGLPQRHNLVFSEGFPRDSSWSWKVFGANSTTEYQLRNKIF